MSFWTPNGYSEEHLGYYYIVYMFIITMFTCFPQFELLHEILQYVGSHKIANSCTNAIEVKRKI